MNPTKLPNDKGLWAVPVPLDINYTTYNEVGFYHEEIGYITKDLISFDVAEWVDPNHGMLNNQYYFRSLLSAAGLHFENPCGEKPKHFDEWKSELDKGYEHEYDAVIMKKWQQAEANLIEKLIIIREI